MQRNIEKYAHDYQNETHNFEEIQVKYRRKKILEFLNQYSPKKILEIGCGFEPIFEYYSQFDEFTCIEPAKVFFETARMKANTQQNIEVINDYLQNTIDYISKKKFDFIILSSLLHEVENTTEFLKDIKSICSKDTIVHINVPNSKSFHLIWAYESNLIPKLGIQTQTARHLQQNTVFDMELLKNLVSQTGFEIIENGSYFVKPFNHAKMSACIENNILDKNLLDGLYKLAKYFPQNGSEIFVNCRIKTK